MATAEPVDADTTDAERSAGTTDAERIAELEATVARLAERLDAAERRSTPVGSGQTPTDAHDVQPSGSRRNLLKLAAGAAAGGTALALGAGARPVAAEDGDFLEVGFETTQGNTGRTATILKYENDEGPQVGASDANVMTVRDDFGTPAGADGSSFPSALGGYAFGAVQNGVYGYTASTGAGVVAVGGGGTAVGLSSRGTRANAHLVGAGDRPLARIDAHVFGELIVDSDGDLWYCTASGTPGSWRKVSGDDTAGSFHAVTPFRVFDSRLEDDGVFTGDENRTISVADARDVTTYDVVAPDAVPNGAFAITGNVVAIQTSDTGFLSINPGGTTAISAATVNWIAGQNVGNAGVFALNTSREVEAVFGPGNGAHMTIDVTGYWL